MKESTISSLFEFLYDYADIRDELEEAMLTLELIQAELGYAMEELRDEMETVEKHMEASSHCLYRYRKPRLPGPRGEQSETVGNCQ